MPILSLRDLLHSNHSLLLLFLAEVAGKNYSLLNIFLLLCCSWSESYLIWLLTTAWRGNFAPPTSMPSPTLHDNCSDWIAEERISQITFANSSTYSSDNCLWSRVYGETKGSLGKSDGKIWFSILHRKHVNCFQVICSLQRKQKEEKDFRCFLQLLFAATTIFFYLIFLHH